MNSYSIRRRFSGILLIMMALLIYSESSSLRASLPKLMLEKYVNVYDEVVRSGLIMAMVSAVLGAWYLVTYNVKVLTKSFKNAELFYDIAALVVMILALYFSDLHPGVFKYLNWFFIMTIILMVIGMPLKSDYAKSDTTKK